MNQATWNLYICKRKTKTIWFLSYFMQKPVEEIIVMTKQTKVHKFEPQSEAAPIVT